MIRLPGRGLYRIYTHDSNISAGRHLEMDRSLLADLEAPFEPGFHRRGTQESKLQRLEFFAFLETFNKTEID